MVPGTSSESSNSSSIHTVRTGGTVRGASVVPHGIFALLGDLASIYFIFIGTYFYEIWPGPLKELLRSEDYALGGTWGLWNLKLLYFMARNLQPTGRLGHARGAPCVESTHLIRICEFDSFRVDA